VTTCVAGVTCGAVDVGASGCDAMLFDVGADEEDVEAKVVSHGPQKYNKQAPTIHKIQATNASGAAGPTFDPATSEAETPQ